MMSSGGLSYKDAGVDLDQYGEAMQKLPPLMKRTHTSRVMELADGFAGLFRLHDNPETPRYRDPVLVSGTDGVGTKIKVAKLAEKFDTIGIDLVAMCVNYCLCLGAEPLFFLDYLALGKDNPTLIAELVKGVSDGCVTAGAALLGGETAIMPDVYGGDEFDLAGFCVGVAERSRLIDGKQIQPGDQLLGIASSGLHSNGFSLVRKVVFERAGLSVTATVDELGGTVGDVLLTPTRIYAREVKAAVALNAAEPQVTGSAHITGGGIEENLERILPAGCRGEVSRSAWTPAPVFGWLQRQGEIADAEMFRVFNMGIGLILVVRPGAVEAVTAALAPLGTPPIRLGEIVAGETSVSVR
jgi:phosphoribosylformylglycinamidine cyclo-ligase